MTSLPIATSPDDLDKQWLTATLRSARLLNEKQSIRKFSYEEVGFGQMSNSYRLFLECDGLGGRPITVIAKLPSHDEGSRAAGQGMQIYRVEINFYREYAANLSIRTPHCYFAEIADNDVDFVLLLEDLAPAKQGDQLRGCNVEQAGLAVQEVAKLHIPHLDDPDIETTDWLNRSSGGLDPSQFMPLIYPEFRKRYEGTIDEAILDMGERFMGKLAAYYEKPRPYTLVHTDYRLDNMLFGGQKGGPAIAIVDWQTLSTGNPMSDVAYFIGAGLETDDRRMHEESLVRDYHATLVREGVADYTWNDCWRHYRLYAFAGFHMAVMASMLVERTERGDEMFRVMAERHGQQVIDLASEDLLA
jgi:hypothetical protein